MISKLSILAIAALYFLASSVNGQECGPAEVRNIAITRDLQLVWEVDRGEFCPPMDLEFVVRIMAEGERERDFRTREPFVDVSFLEICKQWTFLVRALEGNELGPEGVLIDHMPLPEDVNLAIRDFEVAQVEERGEIGLAWALEDPELRECGLEFRIVVEEVRTGHLEDIYVREGFAHLHSFAPCSSYELSIRAISPGQPIMEGPPRSIPFEMPPFPEDAPKIDRAVVGATEAHLEFGLEPFEMNRCPLRELILESGEDIRISIPLDHMEDEKPPIEVDLRDLRPDSMYLLRISVENSAGISRPAQYGLQTLPDDQPGPDPNPN